MRWNKKSLFAVVNNHLIDYPTPINLNYFYGFGSLAGIMLVVQILTGIFLAMHYTPHIDLAFNSVEHIMRDVNNGWLMRYTHANGASFFFIVVYVHIFRGLYYGSYITPRESLWCSGVIIFILMMATAFMGYVLPWGQMSFWGATVITNLFSAIPLVGKDIVDWLWGGFAVDNPTLNRFFSLHFTMPFVIAGAVIIHLVLLHEVGSNNPLGLTLKTENVPFYPYFYVKDLFGLMVLFLVFFTFVFYYPNSLGHPDNYIEANPMKTPLHIVPEWYFLPFYAILRAIPDKLYGVILMIFSIVFIGLFPFFLHIAKRTNFVPQSGFHRVLFRRIIIRFVICFILLGWLGGQPAAGIYITLGVVFTVFFFFVLTINLYFVLLKEMFIYSNYYLIVSKLTQDDFKDYFTYEKKKFDYVVIESTLLDLGEEIIDLSVYEFESSEFVSITIDNMQNDYDIGEIVVHDDAEDITWLCSELDDNFIDYYDETKMIFDHNHRSVVAEPFSTIHWRRGLTLWFELIVQKIYEYKDNGQKKTEEEIEKEKQKLIQYSLDRIAIEPLTEINVNYKDEELNQLLSFPKDNKEVYYLNETTYADLYGYDDCCEHGYVFNHIVHPEFSFNLDNVETEYWNEPIFIFPLIRELHFLREDNDFFDDRYTAPINQEWFSTSEFDESADRFA